MLTEKQERVLKVIIECTNKKGYPPSIREIGEVIGVTSTSTTHAYLVRLEKAGYIQVDKDVRRGIRILKSGA